MKDSSLVKQFEGLRLEKYLDIVGIWTIGYGHVIRHSENYDKGITEEQANTLLEQDMAWARTCVRKSVIVPLNANQWAALVSLCFNIGCDAFSKSTLVKCINKGDYLDAAEQFLRWNRAGGKVSKGLTLRRQKERESFLS